MKKLLILLPIFLMLACTKKQSTQPAIGTTPPPPPVVINLLKGGWKGTLTMDFDGLASLTNDSIHLSIFADSLILRIWGQNHDERYKVDSLKMTDPNISFQKRIAAFQISPGNIFLANVIVRFAATRFGDLMGGSAISAAISGPLKGTGGWTSQRD